MRTPFDFTHMFRTSVGFDRVFQMLENAGGQTTDNWPPYDIQKLAGDHYQITMAVAGFAQKDLTISAEPNLLVVKGEKSDDGSDTYLYRGINMRSFEQRFELADHVEVRHAALHNGLLTIELVREIPEAMKPKRIEIRAEKAQRRIEEKSRAAA